LRHLTNSYDLQDESYSREEERDYSYGTGPRDESRCDESTADYHQDRSWYYVEGQNGEERQECEKKGRGVVHRYVDPDKPQRRRSPPSRVARTRLIGMHEVG
jgi:hypothetical protein